MAQKENYSHPIPLGVPFTDYHEYHLRRLVLREFTSEDFYAPDRHLIHLPGETKVIIQLWML